MVSFSYGVAAESLASTDAAVPFQDQNGTLPMRGQTRSCLMNDCSRPCRDPLIPPYDCVLEDLDFERDPESIGHRDQAPEHPNFGAPAQGPGARGFPPSPGGLRVRSAAADRW
jgi:hypothetical protein